MSVNYYFLANCQLTINPIGTLITISTSSSLLSLYSFLLLFSCFPFLFQSIWCLAAEDLISTEDLISIKRKLDRVLNLNILVYQPYHVRKTPDSGFL